MLKLTHMTTILFSLFCLLAAPCGVANICKIQPHPIIDKPIIFNKQRIELTQAYRASHYGIQSQSIRIVPQMIVLHATANNSLQETLKLFNSPLLSQKERADIAKFSPLNTSAQYLIDRDGSIYRLMPDNWMARHIIGLNNIAIGIENVGGVEGKQDLTPQQVTADIYLIRQLKKKYPTIKYLIGHYEYGRFRHSKLWEEQDPNYFTDKVDPGPIFMEQVRHCVKDLGLKSH